MKRLTFLPAFVLASTCLFLSSSPASGQSYQFTQYFNSFQFLNPSYTGITGHQYRYGLIHRQQWLGVSDGSLAGFQTTGVYGSFTFGHPMASGVLNPSKSNKGPFFTGGLAVLNNRQFGSAFTTTSAVTTFSVLVQLAPKAFLSGGGDVSLHNARVSDYVLVTDYINGNNNVTPGDAVTYPNFSVGLTLVLDKFWIGASLKDVIDTPNGVTFISETKKYYDHLNIHGGYGIPFGDYNTFKLSASYKHWKDIRQLEGSFGFMRNFSNGGSFSSSLGYRGLPKTSEGLSNMDAITLMVGYNNIKWRKQVNQAHKVKGNLSFMVSSDIYSYQFGTAMRTLEVSAILSSPYSKWDRKNCYDYTHGPMAEQIVQNLYGGQSPYAAPGARKDIGEQPGKKKSTIPNKRWNQRNNGMKRNQPGVWRKRY